MMEKDMRPSAAEPMESPQGEVPREDQGKLAETAAGKPARKAGASVSKARTAVRLVVFLAIVVGLFAGVGWGSLSSMGVDAIAYLCPLGSLEVLLASKTAVPRFVVALVVMLVLVVLLGRAFCSWVCPIPPVESFFHYRRKDADSKKRSAEVASDGSSEAAEGVVQAIDRHDSGDQPAPEGAVVGKSAPLTDAERRLLATSCAGVVSATGAATCGKGDSCAACLAPVGGKRDGVRFDTRHGVLLGALASAAVIGFPVFCLVCPVGLAIATVVAVWQVLVAHAPSWSLLVFPLLLALEVVVFRKWCHVLCPMGALMSLLGKKSLFMPNVDDGKCLRSRGVDCHACVNACPEQLDPHVMAQGECTKCGKCKDVCPAHAISMPALLRKE